MAELIKIAIAGGGTGGHLFPALNMARAMAERWNCRFQFFGTRRGIEVRRVTQAGYPMQFIPVAGFQRSLTWKNLLFPFRLVQSLYICRKTLKKFAPDLVIGSGGYVMGPVLKSAQRLGIPTIIQEQNSYPGVTTRLLAKGAEVVFTAYQETAQFLGGAKRVIMAGNPIILQPVTESREELCQFFRLEAQRKTILVFGGSQGAASINRAISRIILDNRVYPDCQILWQTGEREFAHYQTLLKNQPRVRVTSFIEHMAKAYAVADFAVCRAGAMTLSELMAVGLPAILLPLPTAAADHQFKNAKALADRQAAVVLRDDENLADNLVEQISQFASGKRPLTEMAANMKALYRPDTLQIILNEIAWLLKDKISK